MGRIRASRLVTSRGVRKALSLRTWFVVGVISMAACKSVPPASVVVVPERVVSRETKIGWILKLEQERRLRENVPSPPTATASVSAASEPVRVPALDELARDPDPVVRRRAVLALGRMGQSDGTSALVAALRDHDEDVRASAAFALGLLGPAAQPVLDSVQAAVRDTSATVRARALDALGLIGAPSAVPSVYEAAGGCAARLATIEPDDEQWPKSPELEVCRAALFALVRLQNYDGLAAAFALQRINDRRAAAALTALASTPGIYTASFALRGLAALKDPALVPIAKSVLSRPDADVKLRVAAVRALAQIGGRDAAVPLIELLGAPAAPVTLTIEAISALGPSKYEPAFEVLVDFLTHPAPAVRAAAITAAAEVAPEAFLVVLAGRDRDRDWSVRAALARVLAKLPTERIGGAIRELAEDEDARVRAAALETLAALKSSELPSRLLAALEAADFVERATAARLIGEIKLNGAIPRLVAAYERAQSDSAYAARAAALGALAAYGGDEVKTILRRGLGDKEWPVRWRTAELLHGLGEPGAAPERPAPVRHSADWFQSDALLRPPFSPHAFIETTHGTIEAELDMVDAALTSQNFVALARSGFFNGMKIHRVVPGFVVQGGDPRGDGEGGPGYTIRDELSWKPFVRGTLGMALDWRDTGGSQFFITLSPQPHLDGKYTVFGRVVNGWDVLDRLAMWDVIDRIRIWDGVAFQ
jgi:cyclophilin family peptidyl-prolyl cis-trans isomerase/HEAT repeat protein